MPFQVIDPTTAVAAPVTTLGDPLTPVLPATELPGKSLVVMRTQLDIELGGRTDFQDQMFDIWINDAYIDLASSLELDELKGSILLPIIAGQPLYNLPRIIRAIRNLSIVDTQNYGTLGGRKISKSNLDEYRKLRELDEEPTKYFRERGVLVLWPTPKNARDLALDFWIRPEPLVDDNHYPILPPEYHEVIVRNARAKAHSDLREFDKSAITNNEMIGLVRRKQDTDELEEEDRVIGSSVPRRRSQLYRTSKPWSDSDGLR